MGIFGAGAPVGAGLGLLAGGLLLGIFTAVPAGAAVPRPAPALAGDLRRGRPARPGHRGPDARSFPNRAGWAPRAAEPTPGVPVAATVDFLKEQPPDLHRHHARRRLPLSSPSTAGLAGRPTYFVRELGWTYPQIGKALGVILAIAGPVGAIGGYLARRPLAAQGVATRQPARRRRSAASAWRSPAPAWCYAGSPALSVVFLALGAVFSFTLIGVGALIIQETAPAPMRGQVAALFTGVLNIVGAGLGPVAVGLITDYVLRDPSRSARRSS